VSQIQLINLLLRIFLISGFASIVLWVALYSAWARWWRNVIGRTLVVKDALIAMLLVPTSLSLFFNLSRLDSLATAWADVVLIGLITPVMAWRVVAWSRLRRPEAGKHREDQDDDDGAR
jgi:hypothetical protein